MLTGKFIDEIRQQLLGSPGLQCKPLTYFKTIEYVFYWYIELLAKVCPILFGKSTERLSTNGIFSTTLRTRLFFV